MAIGYTTGGVKLLDLGGGQVTSANNPLYAGNLSPMQLGTQASAQGAAGSTPTANQPTPVPGPTLPTTTPNTQTSDRYTQQANDAATFLTQQRDLLKQQQADLKAEIENEYQQKIADQTKANEEAQKTEGALQFKLGQAGTEYGASQTRTQNAERLKAIDALITQKQQLIQKSINAYNQDDLNAVKTYNQQINDLNDKQDALAHQKYSDYLAELASDRADTTLANQTAMDKFNMSKLDTSVVDQGGNKVLINNQTGATIKDLGPTNNVAQTLMTKYPDAGIVNGDSDVTAQGKLKNSLIYQEQTRLVADNNAVKELIKKYPDAKIMPSDDLATAQGKLKDSKIYQQATRLVGKTTPKAQPKSKDILETSGLTDMQKQIIKNLDNVRGKDTYNSPDDISAAAADWHRSGGDMGLFTTITTKRAHENPNNPYYFNKKTPAKAATSTFK